MLIGILLVIAAGLMWTGIGCIYSHVGRRNYDIVTYCLTSSAVSALCAWCVFVDYPVLLRGPVPRAIPMTLCMLAVGLASGVAFLLITWAMRHGSHGVVWTLAQSAMVLPFIAGVILFHDACSMAQGLGVGAIALCILLLGLNLLRKGDALAEPRRKRLWFAAALAAFFLLGINLTLSTVPSRWIDWQDTARLRVPLVYSGVCLAYLPIGIRTWRLEWRYVRLSVISAGVGLLGQYFLYAGMDRLATVNAVSLTYPIGIGVCVVGFVGYCAVWLRESLTILKVLGIASGVLGIVLLSQ